MKQIDELSKGASVNDHIRGLIEAEAPVWIKSFTTSTTSS